MQVLFFCFELLLKVLEFYMQDNFYVQIKNVHALWLLKSGVLLRFNRLTGHF